MPVKLRAGGELLPSSFKVCTASRLIVRVDQGTFANGDIALAPEDRFTIIQYASESTEQWIATCDIA